MSWPLKGGGSPLTISGGDTVGSVKTAVLTGGTGTIQWAHYNATTGAYIGDISGATGSTYTLVSADVGFIIGAYSPSYSPFSHGVTAVSSGPATVPGAPTIGTMTASNGYVTPTWTAPTNTGGSAITGYLVTLSSGQTFSTAAGTTSALIASLNGVAVTATVQAINAIGTGTASAASNSVTPAEPAQALLSNFNVFGTSAEKVYVNEPNRTQVTVKNQSLGNIYVAENADLNYQKNRPSSGFTTVPPGQELVSTNTNTGYCKTIGFTTTAATYNSGTNLVTATATAHGLVVNQTIYVGSAVPAGYNTATYPNSVMVFSVPDANTFTYTPQTTPTGTATTQLVVQPLAVVQVERKVTT